MKNHDIKIVFGLGLLLSATAPLAWAFSPLSPSTDSGISAAVSGSEIKAAGPVTDVEFTVCAPHLDGTADIHVKFVAPTTHVEGYSYAEGLEELTKITIEAYNWDTYDYEVLKQFDNPGIGEVIEADLLNQASGSATYYIVSWNSATTSRYDGYVSVSTYVGYDSPAEVQNLVLDIDYPEVELSWNAPKGGSNGGYVDMDDLTYTVVRSVNQQETVVSEKQAELTFSETLDFDSPKEVSYAVYASTTQGGDGSRCYTGSEVVGPVAILPFYETFPGGKASNVWTYYSSASCMSGSLDINVYSGKYTPFGYLEQGYDEDYGAMSLMCNASYYGSGQSVEAGYESIRFSLQGASHPALSFQEYRMTDASNAAELQVIVKSADSEPVVVDTRRYTTGDRGWNFVVIPLYEFVGETPVSVEFKMTCTDTDNAFVAIDCISVSELPENALSVKDFSLPTEVRSGDSFTVSATVFNSGANDVVDYTVDLYRDGALDAQQAGRALSTGQAETFDFVLRADNTWDEQTMLKIVVNYAADSDVADNSTAEETIGVTLMRPYRLHNKYLYGKRLG